MMLWQDKIAVHLKNMQRTSYMKEPQKPVLLDCAGLESPYPHSPSVIAALKELDMSKLMWQVGDCGYTSLREEVAKYWGVVAKFSPEQVRIGYGSMQILERINKYFVGEGSHVLGYTPQFVEYITEAQMSGASYADVKLDKAKNFAFEVDNILNAMHEQQSILYIDNPNNPTGQNIKPEDLEKILQKAKQLGIIVIVDEAYGDYMPQEVSAIQFVGKFDNMIVTRNFTKGFHFAAYRVGYAIFSPELLECYDQVNLPLSVPAIAAKLAQAALTDAKEHLAKNMQMVQEQKILLKKGLVERGYMVAETLDTCPIMVVGTDKDEDIAAKFLDLGIMTRSGKYYPNLGKQYTRVATPPNAARFLELLDQHN